MSLATPRKGYKSVSNFFRNEIQIPEDWDYPKFHQIVKTNPYTKIEEKRVPYIPMDAVDTEKPHFNYSEERELSDNPSLSKFQNNDTLFARITPSTENGKTCIVENFEHRGIVSSELTVLRTTEQIIPKYLYYYVKSHRIRQFAISQMLGTTGRQRVPDYVFKKDLNIELPPLQEQQKIANILSNVDNLIESTGKVITHSKKVKTGLMQKLLTRGIGHTKFKKVQWLFGKEIDIPEEWENVNVEYVTDKLLSGGTPSTTIAEYWEGNIPWTKGAVLTTNNTTKGEKFISELGLKNSSTSIISKDNLLVVSRVSIGNISINKIDIAINQDITAVILNKTICLTDFLYWNLLQTINILVSFSQGTTIQGFTRKDLSSHKVLLPPLPEQQKIATILSNIDSKITSQEQYKEKLQKLKKSLMQKLLTGEVRV